MKIVYKNTKMADRTASRLPRFLPDISPLPPEFHLKDATAFVLGHDNLAAFKEACFPEAKLSALDEDCNPETLAKRRAYQAQRLDEFCARLGLVVDGPKVIDAWRPSARHPQENTTDIVLVEKQRAEGRPKRCLFLLMELEASGRTPVPEEVDFITGSFRSCRGVNLELVETFAAPLAIRLINKKEGAEPPIGFRILEALVAAGCEYAMASLAKALHHGWGGGENYHRARSLVSAVLAKVDRGELDFLEPVSYAELYSLGAKLWMHGLGGAIDRKKAYELYVSAANMGHGPSSLIVSWFLTPPRPEDEPSVYTGVVEPNFLLAAAYFLQAERAGYNRVTKQFNNAGAK